jgi:hypothetical protein
MFVVIPRQMADLGKVKFVLAHDERRGPQRRTRAASLRSRLSTTSRARRTLLGVVPNLDADPALASTTVAPEDRQDLSATAFRIPVESRGPHSLDHSAHPVIDQEYDWPLHQAGPGVAPLCVHAAAPTVSRCYLDQALSASP